MTPIIAKSNKIERPFFDIFIIKTYQNYNLSKIERGFLVINIIKNRHHIDTQWLNNNLVAYNKKVIGNQWFNENWVIYNEKCI